MANDLGSLLRIAVGLDGFIPIKCCYATIISVDKNEKTCIVESCDENKSINGMKVKYLPEICDGEDDVPEIESTVIIAWSDFTSPFIIKNSWLESKTIIVGNQGWDIRDGKQVFNEGEYGGIVKIIDPEDEDVGLLARMNDLENKYNDLVSKFNTFKSDYDSQITIYNGHIHVTTATIGASPVVGVISPTVSTGIPTTAQNGEDVELTTQTQLENPNITHGLIIEDAT